MSDKKYADTFNNDLEMLKYFQEEFMFRQKHYWDLLIKLFALTLGVTILPIASEVFSISIKPIPQNYLLCFPALGFLISLFSFFLLRKEARKMSSVNEAKYRINRQYMDPKYHYAFYNRNVGTGISDKKKLLSFQMTWFVFTLELIVILGVSYLILFTTY